MRINLAKVVPFVGFLVVALFWLIAQHSGTDAAQDGYDDDYVSPDTSRADAYFDRVAVELATPVSTSTRR